MKLTKNPVFLHYFSKFMVILLFVLKYMFISLLLKMINGFSWSANIMASPFNFEPWDGLYEYFQYYIHLVTWDSMWESCKVLTSFDLPGDHCDPV